MSSVLQISTAVNAEVGVMRGSVASKFLVSGFVSGVDVADAFGAAAFIATPLFQTSFDPDLMQVNFIPPAVAVEPTLVHFVPALGVAA